MVHTKPSLRHPLSSRRSESDTPRASSMHDERATPTARPALLVLRHALGLSRRPRMTTFFIQCEGARRLFPCTANASTRVRLVYNANCLQRPPHITLLPYTTLFRSSHTSAQNHSDPPRTSSTHDERAT